MIKSRTGMFACLAVGVLGLIGVFAAISSDAPRAMHAYLVAFVFWLSLAWGSLGWVQAFNAGRSRWVVLIRRAIEVNASTIPIFAALSLPIFFNLSSLYEWANNPFAGSGEHDLLNFRAFYLGKSFVMARAVLYFALTGALGTALYRWSRLQDARPGEMIYTVRQRFWSAAGLPVLAFCIAFAGIDWVMSLLPGWISTMFGFYLIAGAVVGSMGLFAIQSAWLQSTGLLPSAFPRRGRHNLGTLLFAFTVFWAYVGFAQWMLIWMGNLPEELNWMLLRTVGAWQPVAYFLLIGHFCIPFALLLPVPLKIRPVALAWIGGWVMLCCYVDVYWLVMPHLDAAPHPTWMDLTAFLGVGGIAAATWFFQASRGAAAPLGDQYIHESMQASHG